MKKAKWKSLKDLSIEEQLWFWRSAQVAFDPKRKLKEVHITDDKDHGSHSVLKIWRDKQGFEYGEMTGVRFIMADKEKK